MSQSSASGSLIGSPYAVVVMFFGYGFVMASSYSRMPGIRDQLGCTPTQLAFALVCMGVGIILGMPFAGRLVDRFSSRAVTLVSLGGWVLVPTARSVSVLALTLLITGVGAGVAGVAMNVQGHLVEVRRQKVWMPYWHGFFSVGAVSGALAGAFAASIGLPIGWQLLGVSGFLAVAMCLATTRFIPDAGLHSSAGSEPVEEPIFDEPQALASAPSQAGQRRRSALNPIEILLGIITFATALGEGAANDWLALMLVDNRGAPPGAWGTDLCGFQPDDGHRPVYRRGSHPALRSSTRVAGRRRASLYRGGGAVPGKMFARASVWRPSQSAYSGLNHPSTFAGLHKR